MEQRYPTPPPGFLFFKWKTRHVSDASASLCPVCGESGFVGMGGGFQDPGAQKLLEELEAAGTGSYETYCAKYDGVMLKEHWSRYGECECFNCGVKFWHNFIGYPWGYYYNPATSKIPTGYQTSLLWLL